MLDYSAHPIGAAAGVATLDLVDRLDLPGNARDTGAYLLDRLRDALGDHPKVGEVRGVGLLAAVEYMDDPASGTWFPPMSVAPKIVAEMGRRGVIARALPEGDIVGFAPPLCITREEVDQVVDAVTAATRAVLDG
jgi:Adenosylmethionine-8-amino-7-oxononanoate aminotransferase